jgi:hypothetical protein
MLSWLVKSALKQRVLVLAMAALLVVHLLSPRLAPAKV